MVWANGAAPPSALRPGGRRRAGQALWEALSTPAVRPGSAVETLLRLSSGAPAEHVVRRNLLPEHGRRLRGRSCRFHHRPDLPLLLAEKRFEALPVGPLVENHDLAAVVRAVEAVRDETVLLSRFEDSLHLVLVLRGELLQPLRVAC